MGQMAERLRGELEELLESGTAVAENAARWCKPESGAAASGSTNGSGAMTSAAAHASHAGSGGDRHLLDVPVHFVRGEHEV